MLEAGENRETGEMTMVYDDNDDGGGGGGGGGDDDDDNGGGGDDDDDDDDDDDAMRLLLTRSSSAAMRCASGTVPGLQQSSMKLKNMPDLTTYELTSFFSRTRGASLPPTPTPPDAMLRSRTARHRLSTAQRSSSVSFSAKISETTYNPTGDRKGIRPVKNYVLVCWR